MNIPLTNEEAAYAAEHHGLVYSFLNMNHYPESEFYDIAVFGYLRAVRNYLAHAELQDAYRFSTIAYNAMRTEVSNHFRAQNCLKRKAVTCSYDDDADALYYIDDVMDNVSRSSTSQAVHEKLSEVLTPRQNNVIQLKTQGYKNREISERCGISPSTIWRDTKDAGNAIRNNAPELRELIAA